MKRYEGGGRRNIYGSPFREWGLNNRSLEIKTKKEEEMLSLKWKGLMVVIFGVAIFVAGQALAADTVNIVMIDPLSGPMKDIGDRSVWGAQFAVDEINAAGGLLGKKVKLMPEDSQLKPDVAAR